MSNESVDRLTVPAGSWRSRVHREVLMKLGLIGLVGVALALAVAFFRKNHRILK